MLSKNTPKIGYGFIYVLSNKSMSGIYKIGLTTNSVQQRIKELNSTGVPTTFKTESLYEVEEIHLRVIEQSIHGELKNNDRHHGKEFFKVELFQCCECIERVIKKVTGVPAQNLIDVEKSSNINLSRFKSKVDKITKNKKTPDLSVDEYLSLIKYKKPIETKSWYLGKEGLRHRLTGILIPMVSLVITKNLDFFDVSKLNIQIDGKKIDLIKTSQIQDKKNIGSNFIRCPSCDQNLNVFLSEVTNIECSSCKSSWVEVI
ncbi:MAG: GIY-YIG nuclease family protein [Polynucleobacter sp.]|nr:GIY-YIG nuclease family protein [Polynucleobacter sp.]